MVHIVRTCFHAVGNGTLFTGQVLNLSNSKTFNWIYDCGSTSKKTILNKVGELPTWFNSNNTIDMLVISHFDNDHINGLELLLKTFHVKRLVLPFTEWPQSIREISILGKKGITPSLALFQLNPARWLQVNGLDNNISEIVLVKGGRRNPNDNDDFPDFSAEPQELPVNDNDATSVFFEFGTSFEKFSFKVSKINQKQSIQTSDKSFEFIFYNAEKDFSAIGLIYDSGGQSFAKNSKKHLSIVKAEIEQLIKSMGLYDNIRSLPSDWRQELKKCYEKHFGKTGKARNNISLCMYAAPLKTYIACIERPAILLTGDINLTHDVIDDMERHFKIDRWKSLGIVQVPHHGSQHSWAVGNAVRFIPTTFVLCASGTKHHPHKTVTYDLIHPKSRICIADRKNSFREHFMFFKLE